MTLSDRGSERPTPTDEQVQVRLAARLGRQEAVLGKEKPPRLWVVLGEAALHVRVGTPAVMAEAFEYVLDAARRPNVTLQIVPFAAGTVGPAVGQSFLLASFPDAPPALHVDVPAVALDRRDGGGGAAAYRLQFDHLRALGSPESISAEMIATRVKELTV